MGSGLAESNEIDSGWICRDREILPDPDFVCWVTGLLHQVDGGRGYAAFHNLENALGPSESKEFQVALIKAIWEEMIRRKWNAHRPDLTRLNRFEANDGHLPIEIVGDTVTYKWLHFDPNSIVFAHLYEPPENLDGGRISLVDVRGYLSETGLKLRDVFRSSSRPGHERRLVALDEHRPRMLHSHSVHLDPPGPGQLLMLVIRNDPFVGVAHEIGELRAIDPSLPTARRFLRASIAPHH